MTEIHVCEWENTGKIDNSTSTRSLANASEWYIWRCKNCTSQMGLPYRPPLMECNFPNGLPKKGDKPTFPDTNSWIKEKDWVNARKTARFSILQFFPWAFAHIEQLSGNNRWNEAAQELDELAQHCLNVGRLSAREDHRVDTDIFEALQATERVPLVIRIRETHWHKSEEIPDIQQTSQHRNLVSCTGTIETVRALMRNPSVLRITLGVTE